MSKIVHISDDQRYAMLAIKFGQVETEIGMLNLAIMRYTSELSTMERVLELIEDNLEVLKSKKIIVMAKEYQNARQKAAIANKTLDELDKEISNLFIKLRRLEKERDAILLDMERVKFSMMNRGKVLPFRRKYESEYRSREDKEDS